jgi:hypothetical protein
LETTAAEDVDIYFSFWVSLMILIPWTDVTAFLCLREVAEAGGFEAIEKLFFEFILDAFGFGVMFSSTLNSYSSGLYLRGDVPRNS